MSDLEPLKAIKLIIECCQDDTKLKKEMNNKELKEVKIDIFSKDLFHQLYLNLLYFTTRKKKLQFPKNKHFC